jgi:hypothetical protein
MWNGKSKLAVAVLAATALAIAVVLTVTTDGAAGHHTPVGTGTTVAAGPSTPSAAVTGTFDPSYHPTYLSVPDNGFAALSGPQVAALETLQPPPPVYTPSLPAVSAADRKSAVDFSVAFTRQLFDLDFAATTPAQVAAWAQAEAAGFVMPGVPQQAADNSLFASLFDPTVAGLGSWDQDPLPPPSVWARCAKEKKAWRVANLFAAEDQSWAENIASGEQFPDPLMTVEDVTGTITTTIPGQRPSTRPFKLVVGLGSALHHPGYGAVSVAIGS